KQPPLTYISAQTPTGVQSSLEVRVNGVRWDEVPFLYGREEDERVYAVIHEEDGTPRVRFNGRLPTGQENVTALYRKGIGAAGLVHADQVTLLAVRPLGVRGVTNPLPSSGAADPESRDALRRNLPLAVLTMERLVSLRDYEDFARAFAGFAKAHATVTVDGEQQGIFVTVAGVAGAEVLESSTEFSNLVAAMHTFSDPNLPFAVKPYEPIFFQLEADIVVDDAYLDEAVLAGVETAL
ncbi:MAG: putative baseplate assembly protein, partial [Caldilinea sp.]|nr:putative baseplate assembly protein [Caldilinea sp.]